MEEIMRGLAPYRVVSVVTTSVGTKKLPRKLRRGHP